MCVSVYKFVCFAVHVANEVGTLSLSLSLHPLLPFPSPSPSLPPPPPPLSPKSMVHMFFQHRECAAILASIKHDWTNESQPELSSAPYHRFSREGTSALGAVVC